MREFPTALPSSAYDIWNTSTRPSSLITVAIDTLMFAGLKLCFYFFRAELSIISNGKAGLQSKLQPSSGHTEFITRTLIVHCQDLLTVLFLSADEATQRPKQFNQQYKEKILIFKMDFNMSDY